MAHASITCKTKMHGQKTVCVIGLGYIGLPTAAILARHGHEVIGVDVRSEVVETINRGEIHIHEPGLGELVQDVVAAGNLKASLEPVSADVFFICVPTPFNADKSPDLSYVQAASDAIRPYVRQGSLIILESTSPPKTTEEVVAARAVPAEWTIGRDAFVAHCPERVLPGQILREVVENDRIVGGITEACTTAAASFYEDFVSGNVLRTDAITAELTKLIENSYRDVNIAFANELSTLADRLGADTFEIIELANRHPRVSILTPGPGVGGHCISVDPWFLVHAAPNETTLIRAARQVNDAKPDFVVSQAIKCAKQFDAPVIGCLGLAYKADVDDIRESPSLEIVRALSNAGVGEVIACDPYIPADRLQDLAMTTLDELLRRSDILLLLTDHQVFRDISPQKLKGKQLIDTRGVWRDASRRSTMPLSSPRIDANGVARAA